MLGNEAKDRLRVVDGLSEAAPGRIAADVEYRFLITAAVQSDPRPLGEWLDGDGDGFRATDRPVNASLIDQDHNWTFAGGNGYILTPPESADDVVAAAPVDIGSSDMDRMAIRYSADELLALTSKTTYNQINVASGKLAGVYIRIDEAGFDLGRSRANDQLRQFAKERGLPVVEISVEPKELQAGPADMQEMPAKPGNKLWKISLPEEGMIHEIDVVKLSPGEVPRGMKPNELGFDLRVQEIDPYGQSSYIGHDTEKLILLRSRLEGLAPPTSPDDDEALQFVLSWIDSAAAA